MPDVESGAVRVGFRYQDGEVLSPEREALSLDEETPEAVIDLGDGAGWLTLPDLADLLAQAWDEGLRFGQLHWATNYAGIFENGSPLRQAPNPYRVTRSGPHCDTCSDTGLVDWMIEGDPNCYQEPDSDGKLPCPDCATRPGGSPS